MSDAKNTAAEVSTEVERISTMDVNAAIQGLNTGAAYFSTVKGNDFNTRKLVTNALTSSLPVDENLGKTINLRHFVVQPVELTDEETGEVSTAPRVVLIDNDGTAYHGTSVGLMSSIRNILAGMGDPSEWSEPLPIQVVKQQGKKFKFFTIKLV